MQCRISKICYELEEPRYTEYFSVSKINFVNLNSQYLKQCSFFGIYDKNVSIRITSKPITTAYAEIHAIRYNLNLVYDDCYDGNTILSEIFNNMDINLPIDQDNEYIVEDKRLNPNYTFKNVLNMRKTLYIGIDDIENNELLLNMTFRSENFNVQGSAVFYLGVKNKTPTV